MKNSTRWSTYCMYHNVKHIHHMHIYWSKWINNDGKWVLKKWVVCVINFIEKWFNDMYVLMTGIFLGKNKQTNYDKIQAIYSTTCGITFYIKNRQMTVMKGYSNISNVSKI